MVKLEVAVVPVVVAVPFDAVVDVAVGVEVETELEVLELLVNGLETLAEKT